MLVCSVYENSMPFRKQQKHHFLNMKASTRKFLLLHCIFLCDTHTNRIFKITRTRQHKNLVLKMKVASNPFETRVRFDFKNSSITVAKKGNIFAVHKGNSIREGTRVA